MTNAERPSFVGARRGGHLSFPMVLLACAVLLAASVSNAHPHETALKEMQGEMMALRAQMAKLARRMEGLANEHAPMEAHAEDHPAARRLDESEEVVTLELKLEGGASSRILETADGIGSTRAPERPLWRAR